MKPSTPHHLHVIGAGLIGTSIALAAKSHGWGVSIEDSKPSNNALARDLLAGGNSSEVAPPEEVDIVIVAIPPTQTAIEVCRALNKYPQAVVSDVASVKTKVIQEVRELSDLVSRYVPSHPIAGRQLDGPAAAQSDLFSGRPWVVTPLRENSHEDVQRSENLFTTVGGSVLRMSPSEHDSLFANVSHLPQLLSTLLSSSLLDRGELVALSGQGLRDMTRLAESQAALWGEIIELNSDEILKALGEFRGKLEDLENAVRSSNRTAILEFFDKGKAGRKLFMGKHGGLPRDYVYFRIVIEDRPGVLSELFSLCGEEKINVEDLTIEHSPNQETGLITLAISPEQRSQFERALKDKNWLFHQDSQDTSVN